MHARHRPVLLFTLFVLCASARPQETSIAPGTRSVMDAHNCYPYFEWWSDRIDRALSAGTPLAIEQDLDWYTDKHSGRAWAVVSHGGPLTGQEPTIDRYFFERVRPIVEKAVKDRNRRDWPLITLNLDFKSDNPELLSAIWSVLEKYRDWLTTAPRTKGSEMQLLDVKPILVLTGESDAQEKVFNQKVPIGEKLLAFGAVHSFAGDPMSSPETLAPEAVSNYRRWWNNPWRVVERGGQAEAGDWTPEEEQRLRALVNYAHSRGLWIRFYTLDGATKQELSCFGWFRTYNFGSLAAAQQRWRAAAQAGVDYIASDQYEQLAELLKRQSASPRRRR